MAKSDFMAPVEPVIDPIEPLLAQIQSVLQAEHADDHRAARLGTLAAALRATVRSERDAVATTTARALYTTLLHRNPDDEGLANFVAAYGSGGGSLETLIENILLSDEFRDKALSHQKIAEAAIALALPMITGRAAVADVVMLLARRLVEARRPDAT